MTTLIHNESFDPLKTNWMNVLPPVEGKKIVIFGTPDKDMMEILDRSHCDSVTCRGKLPDKDRWHGVDLIDDDGILEDGSFDLCIVTGKDLLTNTLPENLKMLGKCHESLNRGGTFLIVIPNGFFGLIYRLAMAPVLKRIGFKNIIGFICDKSFDEPRMIYPALGGFKGKKCIYHTITGGSAIRGKKKFVLKDVLKYLAFLTFYPLDPFQGMMVVGTKADAGAADCGIGKGGGARPHHCLMNGGEFYAIWMAKPYICKQVGLIYSIRENKLVAVAKKTNISYHNDHLIRQEYNILEALTNDKSGFADRCIILPRPITFQSADNWMMAVEMPVSGSPLSAMNINEPGMFSEYVRILNKLVSVQKRIQIYMSEELKEILTFIPESYFENSLGVDFGYFNDLGRLVAYGECGQHGDFVDVNIYHDPLNDSIGIIDWEWASCGFPPLFDLFNLFLSAWYRKKGRREESYLEHYRISFIETFFEESHFGEFIQKRIDEYCADLKINRQLIFEYFSDFLLFCYNKYRLNYKFPVYETFHRNNLLYALENRDNFIIK